MDFEFTPAHEAKLADFAKALVDQKNPKILLEPQDRGEGYWFGGGNIVQNHQGAFYIVGRYRNHGDSRTGVGAGARGLELAVFRSEDFYGPYEKVVSFSKADLAWGGNEVVSIEGSCLHLGEDGSVELIVSTEKAIPYPAEVADFQKAGTGVWEIDRMTAPSIDGLSADMVDTLENIVPCGPPSRLHVKDPKTFESGAGTILIYCNHPYVWSSTSSSLAIRPKGGGDFQKITDDALLRGPAWDVAVTRITDMMGVPKLGAFADAPTMALYFYDGAEFVRQLDENPAAVTRPRGYSCEELGGIAVGIAAQFPRIDRLCPDRPLLVSPHGTGCSRYVSTVKTEDGIYATWQQSQPDLSQPLMGHHLTMDQVEEILA